MTTKVEPELERSSGKTNPLFVRSGSSLKFFRRRLSTLLGMIIALLVFELALRPLATGLSDLPAPTSGFRPNANLAAPAKELRQFIEGIAVSHFSQDGARLTGNQQLAGASMGLILGDSYVEAKQVSDELTLGSVLERLSRAEGKPLNVRQYGWSGAGIPTYLAAADSMLAELNPQWVVIILNEDDLGLAPLHSTRYWRMIIKPDDSVQLIEIERSAAKMQPLLSKVGLTVSDLRQALDASSLVFLSVQRFQQISAISQAAQEDERPASEVGGAARKEQAEIERVMRVSVRALNEAYKRRLTIVYIPDINVTASNEPDQGEEELLSACSKEGVACFSARAVMLAQRDRNQQLSQGFHNTILGHGHLNEVGHRVIAEEIWRVLSRSAMEYGGK